MPQFVVPQFIDVEDKIFGPITTRQFLILLVVGMICFLGWRFGDTATFVTILATVGGGGVVIAFVKVNGQPFHFFLLNIIQTLGKPGTRIWYKHYSKDDLNYYRNQIPEVVDIVENTKRPVRRARIRDLSLVVNTGGFYEGDDDADMNFDIGQRL
jgi:hypothetical protein